MALPESSLSVICVSISDFVRVGLNAAANNITMAMGAPAEVPDSDDEHRLNLFFYRFEPSAFQASAYPGDPWRVRLFCMITAFGVDEDGIAAGENELRLLGEILRIFREAPIMPEVLVSGESVRLQVIFSPATDEQVNQIWSTQGDTTYRPSVIYEMALTPIMPSTLRVHPSVVGAIGHEAQSGSNRFDPFSGSIQGPPVVRSNVDIANPLWAPQLSWVYQSNCAHTLSFDIDSAEFAAFVPQVWLAGDTADSVDIVWEIWDSNGWRPAGVPVVSTPSSQGIDPDNIPAANPGIFPQTLALPFAVPVGENAAQGIVYATRSVTLVVGGDPVEVRSNPLLLSLYRVTP